jgi:hypothetical protein
MYSRLHFTSVGIYVCHTDFCKKLFPLLWKYYLFKTEEQACWRLAPLVDDWWLMKCACVICRCNGGYFLFQAIFVSGDCLLKEDCIMSSDWFTTENLRLWRICRHDGQHRITVSICLSGFRCDLRLRFCSFEELTLLNMAVEWDSVSSYGQETVFQYVIAFETVDTVCIWLTVMFISSFMKEVGFYPVAQTWSPSEPEDCEEVFVLRWCSVTNSEVILKFSIYVLVRRWDCGTQLTSYPSGNRITWPSREFDRHPIGDSVTPCCTCMSSWCHGGKFWVYCELLNMLAVGWVCKQSYGLMSEVRLKWSLRNVWVKCVRNCSTRWE